MERRIPLDDICEKKIDTLPSQYDGEIEYIDISSVDNVEKIIVNTQIIDAKKAPSRAKQLVKYGDILVSTVRPNLNAVAVVQRESERVLVASTGYCILRCDSKTNNHYVFHFCQSPYFIDDMVRQATGASYPAVSNSIVKNCLIPLRSCEEQQHIAAVLDKVSDLISLRKQQLAKLDELIKARFVEMFGKCERRDFIGNVTAISRGASPRPISEFVTDNPDGVNWIKIGDVSENALYIERTDEKITLEGANKSRYVHKGDFILSNSMSFGRPYILNIDGCVHDGWLIISEYLATFQPLYLYYAIRDDEVQNQFSGKVNGATVKNLNSDLVKSTMIKIPSMESQQRFSEFVLKVEDTKLTIQQSLDKLEVLKKSLMQEYFG